MDIAAFQIYYPELIIVDSRVTWCGSNMQFYNFSLQKWQPLANDAECLLFREKDLTLEMVEGSIKSTKLLEDFDVAMVYVREAANTTMIGIVRGKQLKQSDEMDFAFDDFNFENGSEGQVSNNFEAPDFFSPEDELKNLL